MKQRYILTVDLGTSETKTLLFDALGRKIACNSEATPIEKPQPGYCEVDLEAFYVRICKLIRKTIQDAEVNKEDIMAVSLTAYMSGCILLDAKYRFVDKHVVWIDGRSAETIEDWKRDGRMDTLCAITGNGPQVGFSLFILAWYAKHRPDVLERARYFLYPKDWIRFKLTGEINTDLSDATQFLADTANRRYSDKILDISGLKPYSGIFPPLIPSDAVAGSVTQRAAEETGLREGTKVICGLADLMAGTLGVGSVENGDCTTVIGTTLANSVVMERPDFQPLGIGMTIATVNEKWVRLMVSNGGGTINSQWAFDQIAGVHASDFSSNEAYYAYLNNLIKGTQPCANGTMFHPYINSGVSAPFITTTARALFTGINPQTTKADLLRAVYEGIAMATRDCYEAMTATANQVRVSGGGSKSDELCQIVADCIGKELIRQRETESTSLGCAILACVGLGWYKDFREAVSVMVEITDRFYPDPKNKEKYDAWFQAFKAVRETMVPAWEIQKKSWLAIQAM